MNILDAFHHSLERGVTSGAPISSDSFESWLDNEVTQRFMAEMALNLSDAYREPITGDSDQIIKLAHTRNEAIANFESILNWKPSELESNT